MNKGHHERVCVTVFHRVGMLGLGSVIWPSNITVGMVLWGQVDTGRSLR